MNHHRGTDQVVLEFIELAPMRENDVSKFSFAQTMVIRNIPWSSRDAVGFVDDANEPLYLFSLRKHASCNSMYTACQKLANLPSLSDFEKILGNIMCK